MDKVNQLSSLYYSLANAYDTLKDELQELDNINDSIRASYDQIGVLKEKILQLESK
jgi:hypothetical protein